MAFLSYLTEPAEQAVGLYLRLSYELILATESQGNRWIKVWFSKLWFIERAALNFLDSWIWLKKLHDLLKTKNHFVNLWSSCDQTLTATAFHWTLSSEKKRDNSSSYQIIKFGCSRNHVSASSGDVSVSMFHWITRYNAFIFFICDLMNNNKIITLLLLLNTLQVFHSLWYIRLCFFMCKMINSLPWSCL